VTAPLRIVARDRTYEVAVGAGLLGELGARMRDAKIGGRTALISDQNVAAQWGGVARAALAAADYQVTPFVIEPGEASKTLASADKLFDALIEAGIGRGDHIVALGGGVVGDLAGFVAATLHRGIGFVQAPTSLLAQVDSSVGGKVAVDHRLGKNLIGAFYAPHLVIVDTRALQTLPARERWSGMAEILKAAFIRDSDLFELLERRLEDFGAGTASPEETAALVRRALEIKADVVGQDEHEAGLRMLLNFGHTYGHALEAAAGYGALTHGEAVVHGMRVALRMSVKLGRLDLAQAERGKRLLGRFPTPAWPALDPGEVMAAMSRDKKVQHGKMRFVVLDKIGAAVIDTSLTVSALEEGARFAAAGP
jgi:3-dehydroquinate synthase